MIERIGIIGGTGQMGQMFERHFKEAGRQVVVSDHTSKHKEKELVLNSDLVIISVPIDETIHVIKRIRDWLRPDQILSDFTSVKNNIIPVLMETDATVISCHPVFGGMVDMSGQNIVLMPIRERKALSKMKRLFEALHLNVVVMQDWKKHDECMSVIQGLTHFIHIAFTHTLKSKSIDLDTILSICSPVYQANFAFACRILQRDPHLYTHILMDNPGNEHILSDFLDQAGESLKLIRKKDDQAFQKQFLESREYLGEYGKQFSEQSDFLVEQLKNFSK